jgi:hypothetical protein
MEDEGQAFTTGLMFAVAGITAGIVGLIQNSVWVWGFLFVVPFGLLLVAWMIFPPRNY